MTTGGGGLCADFLLHRNRNQQTYNLGLFVVLESRHDIDVKLTNISG